MYLQLQEQRVEQISIIYNQSVVNSSQICSKRINNFNMHQNQFIVPLCCLLYVFYNAFYAFVAANQKFSCDDPAAMQIMHISGIIFIKFV